MTEHAANRTTLRPARPEDFEYCARQYFEAMDAIIKDLNLDMDAQIAAFRQRWDATQFGSRQSMRQTPVGCKGSRRMRRSHGWKCWPLSVRDYRPQSVTTFTDLLRQMTRQVPPHVGMVASSPAAALTQGVGG
jgi:hypothetical protein